MMIYWCVVCFQHIACVLWNGHYCSDNKQELVPSFQLNTILLWLYHDVLAMTVGKWPVVQLYQLMWTQIRYIAITIKFIWKISIGHQNYLATNDIFIFIFFWTLQVGRIHLYYIWHTWFRIHRNVAKQVTWGSYQRW